ncbi:hypothetical protein F2Q70_00030830 [Brassica cretica]|uniref:Uncharacterized protein n=1 Tax=Brassica cretica TaxID=69181 RepID=A0A8S9FF75_BRACR|nr:hypothetical protein F2Q70_00030830 [Brassica cretica]
MKWVRYGLQETASKGRRECMDSCRIDRPSGTDARSLRSDRAWLELVRYVATELGLSSVATYQPSGTDARSLRSDRACLERYVATELGLSAT